MKDNKLIIYKNSDGNIIVDAIYKDETLWLSQKGMSKVFDVGVPAISKHLKNIFEENITNELKLFVDLYNISKHVILSNDDLDRTFHADDAIICYFACRIVGKKILLMIDEKKEKEKYEIDWDKYGIKINRF